MRAIIRTKDQVLLEQAAALRSAALELEQLCGDPSYMPPPPRQPHVSWHQSLRAKKISVPAAGWAAGIALAIEILHVVVEHLR